MRDFAERVTNDDDVFKKNDLRTTYNMIYRDKSSNKTYLKRFPVKGVTRNKDYNLGSKTFLSKQAKIEIYRFFQGAQAPN